MIPRDDATEAQIRAARPTVSTWLSANAGSGKTRVLTDRVARLLLNGELPQHILCLTYTKAAASEMQNRLFRRLGKWAMLPEDRLRGELRELGESGDLSEAALRNARTLFARAIETPGGLKIQTIHSFCASLLRRFPLEAGVSPQFTEMEERAADLLRLDIVDQMAEGADAALVAAVARYITDEDFGKLTAAIVREREAFADPLDWPRALALFGQPSDLTEDRIERAVFLGREQEVLAAVIPVMLSTDGNDAKAANLLAGISELNFAALETLEGIFLTRAGAATPFSAKIGSFPTKPTRTAIAEHLAALEDLMLRVEAARDARLALSAARKSLALHRFADRFLGLYEAQKLLRAWLDFDDLILKARQLLSDPDVAAWVLYRIDGGIDHILVDEAQDTSPAQWDVVRKLTEEFASGDGARSETRRTLFVVGDKKQSIYSFQGADPREFDLMQTEFKTRLEAAGRAFQSESLAYSFRSSAAILRIVDQAFVNHDQAGFVSDKGHIAFKTALPGRVDLWPLVPKQEDTDDRVWTDPVDRRGGKHHTVILANMIARQIKTMLDQGQSIPVDIAGGGGHGKRPVRAGDFLILVQRRSALFSELIRACKSHGLPIAGADRLKVGAELAVRDLAALLSFLAVPEDSLSLATALKSPLFGWGEQALFDLAHRRTQDHLWQALRKREHEFADTVAQLNDLRSQVDYLRPYDLIERILTRHNGRRKLLARLGAEAEDGINALLTQALSYERNAVPSLTGFLVWMETDDLEVKRQVDSASDQIRVMTVHGAKGLEAPIVILPDSGRRPNVVRDSILTVGGTPVWRTATDEMSGVMRTRVEEMKEAEFNERLRLLYVALTRAEKWLIIAAAGDLPKEENTWYQMVSAVMQNADTTEFDLEGQSGLRLEHGDWEGLPEVEEPTKVMASADLDSHFWRPAPDIPAEPETLSPSELGGTKAIAGDLGTDEETAKRYGTLVHEMLEHLSASPEDEWPGLLDLLCANANAAEARDAALEAQAVLRDPALRHVFGPNALTEVTISAALGAHRLHGKIDRLIIEDNRILAIDFKTNRVVPGTALDCPEGLLRQMGSYAHALTQIYPGRRIETAILWTRTGDLMPIPHDIVSRALQSTPYLDEVVRAT